MSRQSGVRARMAVAAAAVLAVGVTLTACAPADDAVSGSSAAPATGFPVTIDNCGTTQTFTEPPSRVLVMRGASVGEVESLIELGVQDSIIANTQNYGVSDIPGMAERVDAVPTGGLTLADSGDVSAEQILALRPDLVISTWSGGFDPKYGSATRATLGQAGIRTLVTPVNCAYGKPGQVSAAERAAYRNGSTESSAEFLELLGKIYGRPDRGTAAANRLRDRIRAVGQRVEGRPVKRMLVVFPGMSAMNAAGLPAVMSGSIYDSVVRAAGGEPSFPDGGADLTSSLSAERLAGAEVDVLVVGGSRAGEDLDARARELFARYPQWNASKTRSYVTVSDGVYYGPANADAVEKIARVAHPDAF
ncbi:ABC transporter substrate-binding protein [Gordonia sinesedis]